MKLARHQENMKRYSSQYRTAKEKTLLKTERISKSSKRVSSVGIVIAILVVLLVIIIFGSGIISLYKNAKIKSNKQNYSNNIMNYVNSKQYEKIYDYCEEQNIVKEDGPLKEYYPIIWSSFYYRNTLKYYEYYLSAMEEDSNDSDSERLDFCEQLMDFYYEVRIEKYSDIEGYDTEFNRETIKGMCDSMSELVKTGCRLTDDDIRILPMLTYTKMKSMIEERLSDAR